MSNSTESGCLGKTIFATFEHADRARKRQARQRGKRAVAPYRCTSCGRWHLGATVGGAR